MVEWLSQEGQLAGRQSIQSMYGVLGRSKSVSNLDTGGTSARGRGMMSRYKTTSCAVDGHVMLLYTRKQRCLSCDITTCTQHPS